MEKCTVARKTFTGYAPTEISEIEVNGRVFQLNPSVPGDVLLDFLSKADSEDPASMAGTLRSLLDQAINLAQLDEWHAFIRDPAQGITLELLAEIAGYVTEVVSGPGNPSQPLAR